MLKKQIEKMINSCIEGKRDGLTVGYSEHGLAADICSLFLKEYEKGKPKEKESRKGNVKLVNAWIEGWNAHKLVSDELIYKMLKTK